MVEKQDPEGSKKNRIITILGPTACGKTRRAVDLARSIKGEIVSADSRQVYRDMNIGTGKDIEEYEEIAYHLIDICEAGEKYNLHRYIKDFHEALDKIKKKDKNTILCGGTGLYLETALSGVVLPDVPENPPLRQELEKLSLDELTRILKSYKSLHNTTDIDTVKRAVRAIEIARFYEQNPQLAIHADRKKVEPIDSLIIGIDIPRDMRRARITERLHKRLESGMIREVERLLGKGIPPEDLIYYGLEYKYLTLYLIGRFSYQEMVNELEIAIHQFAKRQMTWFRGMEKRGFHIHWLPYDLPKEEFIETVLKID